MAHRWLILAAAAVCIVGLGLAVWSRPRHTPAVSKENADLVHAGMKFEQVRDLFGQNAFAGHFCETLHQSWYDSKTGSRISVAFDREGFAESVAVASKGSVMVKQLDVTWVTRIARRARW